MTTLPAPESATAEHANAVDRLSYLHWALNAHRTPEKTRGELWRRVEEDYLRQIEAAQREVARLSALQTTDAAM